MSSSGPWLTLMFIVVVNVVIALATGGTVAVATLVSLSVMTAGLVTFISVMSFNTSDIFSVGSGTLFALKAASMAAYVGGLVATVFTVGAYGGPGVVVDIINLGLGGLALFQALQAAKVGS